MVCYLYRVAVICIETCDKNILMKVSTYSVCCFTLSNVLVCISSGHPRWRYCQQDPFIHSTYQKIQNHLLSQVWNSSLYSANGTMCTWPLAYTQGLLLSAVVPCIAVLTVLLLTKRHDWSSQLFDLSYTGSHLQYCCCFEKSQVPFLWVLIVRSCCWQLYVPFTGIKRLICVQSCTCIVPDTNFFGYLLLGNGLVSKINR